MNIYYKFSCTVLTFNFFFITHNNLWFVNFPLRKGKWQLLNILLHITHLGRDTEESLIEVYLCLEFKYLTSLLYCKKTFVLLIWHTTSNTTNMHLWNNCWYPYKWFPIINAYIDFTIPPTTSNSTQDSCLIKYTILVICLIALLWKSLNHVQLFVTPCTKQSMELSRPEYWSGKPFPSPGDLPDPGIEPNTLHGRWVLYQLSLKGSPKAL